MADAVLLSEDALTELVEILTGVVNLSGDGVRNERGRQIVISQLQSFQRGRSGRRFKLRTVQVTTLYNASHVEWTDYATDGFPTHCKVREVGTAASSSSEGDTSIYVKLNEHPLAATGFIPAVDDRIVYLPGGNEAVPGATGDDAFFAGWVVGHAGGDGDADADGGPHLKAGIGVCFPVTVTKTAGSDGDDSSAASWTYTAEDLDGNELGTALSPENQRPTVGSVTFGTKGYGYFKNNSGTPQFVLGIINEVPDAEACS